MHTLNTILAQASGNQEAAIAAGIMAFFAAFFLVFVVIGIVALIGMWKVFTKAGEPGWAVLVPIYNPSKSPALNPTAPRFLRQSNSPPTFPTRSTPNSAACNLISTSAPPKSPGTLNSWNKPRLGNPPLP